ncbi:MAG: hypothetical protein MZW92_10540 [Comamonadaceae bacterium]|nr:hypothetical protein [Comamonadaceae bacterium]
MLQEGHRLKSDGIDVVIGLLETHGRADTARLAEGLEVVPRRQPALPGHRRGRDGRGCRPGAASRRSPWSTSWPTPTSPASRNAKRYEDVQDILAAGIHVITHAERPAPGEPLQHRREGRRGQGARAPPRQRAGRSRSDRQRGPDHRRTCASASQEGKVYPAERIETALANFFTPSQPGEAPGADPPGAGRPDRPAPPRGPREEGGEAAPDQVMVCLSSRGPNSEKLLRYASRLAGKLNRNWYAVYVQTPAEEATVIDSPDPAPAVRTR